MRQEDKNYEYRITSAPITVLEGEKKGKMVYTIRGYASLFDIEFDLGLKTESVAFGAFDGAIMTDIRCLFNHDPSLILGRNTTNTCKVGVDNLGLWYSCILPDSPNGENVRVAIERGDVTQCSFAFRLPNPYTSDGGILVIQPTKANGRTKPHQIITRIHEVGDVSPVTYPANPATRVNISASGQQALYTAPGSAVIAQRKRHLDILKAQNDIYGELLAYEKLAAENERQRHLANLYKQLNNPKSKF